MIAENTEKLENIAQSLRERQWWAYDSFGVVYGDWHLTIDRKPNVYRPFLFAVAGVKRMRPFAASRITCNKRYQSIDAAVLHIFNEFNEDTAVKNRFSTLDEAISKICGARKIDSDRENAPDPAENLTFGAGGDDDGPAWWRMRKTN